MSRPSLAQRQILEALERAGSAFAAHVTEDSRQFDSISTILREIQSDTKSLLASRSFTRGVVKAILLYSTAVSTIIGLVIAYLSRN